MQPNNNIVKLYSLGVLGLAFITSLVVMAVDLITRPETALPSLVTLVVGTMVGYAANTLGVQLGTQQTLEAAQHTQDIVNNANKT